MLRIAFGALLSHWRRHPVQALTLVLGLALATALWSGVQAINAEARASYDRAADTLGGTRPVLRSESGPIDEATYVALRRAGWQVTPVVEGWIRGDGGRVRLLGIDPLTAPADMAAEGAGGEVDLLAFIGAPGQLIATPETAARLGGADLPPVIVAENAAPGVALADIGVAQRLLGLEGRITRLVVLDRQPRDRAEFSEVAPGLVMAEPETAEDLGRLTDSFHLNLTAFGLLSFAVGLFIVHGAIGLAFEQRRPMFRTLRALGLPGATLTALVATELVAFALVAGLLGIVLGYGVAAALIPDVAASLRGLYGVPVEGTLSLRPAWWAAGIGMCLAGTAVAAAGVIWKVRRLPVLAPARPRAWARAAEGTVRWQAGASAALAAIALAAGVTAGGLLAGFVMLGALLLAAALALPVALAGVTGIGEWRARSVLAEWFWADTRQQLPGLSLALMALLLAIAANIGVGTMVSSFRLTFTGWLDQRLASELYVNAESEEQARRLVDWLAPRVEAVLPIWSVEAEVLGAPADIFGVADHRTYRANWPLLSALPDVWDRIQSGEVVLVNEQLARREALSPGDPIALPGGWRPLVGGVYSDYGNPLGQVIVGINELTGRFPEVERLRYGIRVDPGAVSALAQAITEHVGVPADNMTDQASLKRFSLEVFERTFTVTGALNVLTLSVAGFAVFAALTTLATMRLPQLAPVWAAGLTRAHLARIELVRALALAFLTFVLAIPVGLTLAWVLLAVVNVEAFGWRLPMHLFPLDWLRLGALALLAATLASLWPAIRLTRIAPADLLRVFTNER